ncbi:DUF1835 domain-containing protein [Sporolactobacillus sp. CPB3-1]|uniref:DUF1835 domain-containing protein n=1 Tax=Sporolactobacillus mangiferae TaxID=2940498 RepID=A0ABT0M9X6_9BACL|nr:DUF1835 domain-containing protein [Sporolactobacillus mangiferae]MCL1631676.1 DUF1835 domain-containing protein [Sporolactobacillus mangiferae]
MYDNFVEALDQLTEREAKRLLLRLYTETAAAGDMPDGEKRVISLLNHMFSDIQQLQTGQPLTQQDLNQVHIVCGESAAGSLRVALSGLEVRQKRVIALSSDLSIGPLSHLDDQSGMAEREAWIQETFTEFSEEGEHPISESVKAIRAIPDHIPIIIWTSDNACEQTGLCFILHLLRNP